MKFKTLTRRQAIFSMGALGITLTSNHPKNLALAETIRLQAEIFFDPHIPTALRNAQNYAGEEGFVASMPQLLHARSTAPYNNIIWNTWFTANSEESVVLSPQNNHVVVAIHGGGIFSTPERFELSYHADLDSSNTHGLTGQGAAKISPTEARDILEGKLPDGSIIPIYTFSELKKGITNLPSRYGVTIDYNLAKKSKRGYEDFSILKEDPNMIIRAGGLEPLAAYLDKFQKRNNTKRMGNWHPYLRINLNQSQCRIPFLAGNKGGIDSDSDGPGTLGWGYDNEYGLGGDANIVGMARYVAVGKRDISASLRNLDFNL